MVRSRVSVRIVRRRVGARKRRKIRISGKEMLERIMLVLLLLRFFWLRDHSLCTQMRFLSRF